MSNKFFGQFLLEKGVISKTQLLTAIDLQKASHFSLGQIAINKGYLTPEDAKRINFEQQRTDERFGALAVSMGLLKGKQVSELFITQQNSRKFFGEVLVEQEIVSKLMLIEYLEEHADLKKQSTLRLDGAIYSHQHGKLIADTINTAVRLFSRIVKIQVQVSDLIMEDVKVEEGQLAFSQSAELPEPIKIGFIMKKELIVTVANNFLDMDVSDNPAVYQDAVCEFLNIILGNSLAGHGESALTELAPPEINEAGSDLKAPHKSAFNIIISAPDQSFVLFLYDN